MDKLLRELKPVFLPGEAVKIIESIESPYMEADMMMAIVTWAILGGIDDASFWSERAQEKFEIIQGIVQKSYADYFSLILSEEIERSEVFSKEFSAAVCESQNAKEKCFAPFLFRREYLKAAFKAEDEDIAGEILYATLKYGTQGPKACCISLRDSSREILDTIKGNILGRRKGQMEYCLGRQEEEKMLERTRQLAKQDHETQLAGFQEIIQIIYSKGHKSPYHSFYWYESYLEFLSHLQNESKKQLLEAIVRYGTEGMRGLYDIEDEYAKVAFAGIKPSITASQKRYYKAKKDGRSGGRPERFPRKLFVMMATRGFCTTREMANFLGSVHISASMIRAK